MNVPTLMNLKDILWFFLTYNFSCMREWLVDWDTGLVG